jgi:WD40 repeat protein
MIKYITKLFISDVRFYIGSNLVRKNRKGARKAIGRSYKVYYKSHLAAASFVREQSSNVYLFYYVIIRADRYCLVASASKDATVKVWDPVQLQCVYTLHQHTDAITCLRWSGEGFIYTGSRDRTIKVWESSNVRTFHGSL